MPFSMCVCAFVAGILPHCSQINGVTSRFEMPALRLVITSNNLMPEKKKSRYFGKLLFYYEFKRGDISRLNTHLSTVSLIFILSRYYE